MRLYGLMSIVLFAFLSCKNHSEQLTLEYKEEVENLKTDTLKKAYLEAIFKADQKVRDTQEEQSIVSKYGRDSQEYEYRIKRMKETDAINLQKTEVYLNNWGYPNKIELGEIAALAPWLVIHHASSYKPREKNFPFLRNGYLNGDIEEGQFSMYLSRMFRLKYGERLDMDGPYKEKDKINRLIKELDLITEN